MSAVLSEHLLPYYKGHATTRRPSTLLPKCLLDFEVMLVETGVDQLDIITNLVRIKRGYLHTVVNVDEIR